jgi:hypothetical protein
VANIKITDLVTLTDPVSTDVLPIVDVSLDVTKKISIAEVLRTAALGSQTDPGISFDGETSGVYSPGANQLAFTTNGSEALRIDSDGLVGIGTTDPDELLHIEGEAAEFRGTNTNPIQLSAGTEQVFKFGIEGQKNNVYGPAGSIIFRQDGSTWSTVEPNFKPTRIEFCTQDSTATDTSETPRLVVDQSGHVGVGTTDPLSLLTVKSPLFNTVETVASFGNSTIPDGLQIITNGNLDWGFNAINSRNLTFSTNQNEKVRITSGGLVGVGTTLPEANLHIKSNLNTELRIEDQGEYLSLLYNDNGSSLSVGVLNADNGNTSVADTELRIGVDGANRYVTKADGSHTFYQTNGSTESMMINSAGDVGIGTTGDPGEKLEVNGTIKATDINFTGLATYADDSAAGTGGLVAGDVYKTSTGELRIKL